MNLIREIFDWVKTRPLWFQDAARRLYEKPTGLSDEDYQDIYALFKKDNGISDEQLDARAIDDNLIPSEEDNQRITIKSLHSLKHVNAIDSTQKLSFSESGLTVIYGENGSGKSGYARVFKNACFSRDKTETIQTDVTKPGEKSKIPEAVFELSNEGHEKSLRWTSGGDVSNKDLSAISVFDAKSARATITKEQELAYLPYGMDILQHMADNVILRVKERAVAERDAQS